MVLGESSVLFNDVELLVGGCASQPALLGDIGADFNIVEVLDRDTAGDLRVPGIPGGLQLPVVGLNKRRQRIHLRWSLVSSHKAHASDA